jgi:multisubunit Na+/H+ antiporter MnhE subunit
MNVLNTIIIATFSWIIMAPLLHADYIFYGIVSIVTVTIICIKLGITATKTTCSVLHPRLIIYLFRLIYEVIKSAISTTVIILTSRNSSLGHFVRVSTNQTDPHKLTLLAHSITITPGTITVGEGDGYLVIHCLTRFMAPVREEHDFEKLINKI